MINAMLQLVPHINVKNRTLMQEDYATDIKTKGRVYDNQHMQQIK